MGRTGVMWVVAIVASFVALAAPSPARGNPACPYRVVVSRADLSRSRSAPVCDLNRIAQWLAAVSDATVSAHPPHGALHRGYVVTVVAVPKHPREVPSRRWRVLLTERVYPVAEAGPVAFVPKRTILFHHPGPFPKWVVRVGWRPLDTSERLPPVLARLGMLRPTPGVATSSAVPTPTSAVPTPTSSPLGSKPARPDLVTLLFLVLALAFIGGIVRRNAMKTHPR